MKVTGATGVLLLVVLAPHAFPQEPGNPRALPQDEKKRPGRFKVGPLYLTPRLQIKNVGVDTNVFNTQTGATPDNSAVLSPTLEGVMPVGRRLRLTGAGSLDLNYFRRRGSESSTDFSGRGGAELKLGLVTLFGSGGGGQARQRFSIDLDDRVLRLEKFAEGGVRLGVSRRISLTTVALSQVYHFGDLEVGGQPVRNILDRNTLTASGQLRYALTNQTTFVAQGDVIEDRFLGDSRDAVSRTVRSYRYLGGFEFGPRALVSGRVLAGIREFPRAFAGGAPTYRGPSLAVNASLPLFQVGRLSGSADRDVFYAVRGGASTADRLRNTYVSSRFRLEPSVDLPFGLVGRGLFGFEEAKYTLPVDLGGAFVRRIDHLWTGGGSLLRRARDGVLIGATVTWVRRVSNLQGVSFQGFRYGLQAEVAP